MYGQDNRSVLFAFPAKRKSYADLKNVIGFEKGELDQGID